VIISAPASGVRNAGENVSVELALVPVESDESEFPASLSLEIASLDARVSVAIPLTGSRYLGSFAVEPGHGDYLLTARWVEGGLESSPVLIKVNTAPILKLSVTPAPMRGIGVDDTVFGDPLASYSLAHRRDESIEVLVWSSDTDLDSNSVELRASLAGGPPYFVPVSSAPLGACLQSGIAFCGTAIVDLWKPEMNAVRGAIKLDVIGKDTGGNTGTATHDGLITRWKWTHASQLPAVMPAVASNGSLVLAYATGFGDGRLDALTHAGTYAWRLSGIDPRTPVIGRTQNGLEPVYFAAYDGQSDTNSFRAVSILDGGILGSCGPFPRNDYGRSSPALVEVAAEGGPRELAIVEMNGPLVVLGDVALNSTCVEIPDAGHETGYPRALTAVGARVFYPDSHSVHSLDFGEDAAPLVSAWSIDAGPIGGLDALIVSGEYLFGSGTDRMVGVKLSGEQWSIRNTSHPSNALRLGGAVALDAGVVLAGRVDNEVVPIRLGGGLLATSHVNAFVELSPAVGEGGYVYTTDVSGALQVWRGGDFGVALWSVDLGEWATSLSLDCSRGTDNNVLSGMPGVAYVGAYKGGTEYSLSALIVDSRGLSMDSPWPKALHDLRNSSNSATDLSEFECK
jgi:hypothetical protein